MNKVLLTGRLTRDPELRQLASGKAVATFGIATNEYRTGQEKSEFHNIVAWDKLAQICAQYIGKGQQVAVDGRLQTRHWDDDQGKRFVFRACLREISGHRVLMQPTGAPRRVGLRHRHGDGPRRDGAREADLVEALEGHVARLHAHRHQDRRRHRGRRAPLPSWPFRVARATSTRTRASRVTVCGSPAARASCSALRQAMPQLARSSSTSSSAGARCASTSRTSATR